MTNRFKKILYRELWRDNFTLPLLIELCLSCENTHIIVDASKESALHDQNSASRSRLDEVRKWNALKGNRVDVITGNYAPFGEELIFDNTLIVEHVRLTETLAENKKIYRKAIATNPGGHAYMPTPIPIVPEEGTMWWYFRNNFFDSITPWPTYFLVWNGTKVAEQALSSEVGKEFPPAWQIDTLFFLKIRCAKPHRVLLLDELAKRELLFSPDDDIEASSTSGRWTCVDPNDELDMQLEQVGGTHYTAGRKLQANDNLDGDIYANPPTHYTRSFIDVVTETAIGNAFITEKTVWPIVYMKPFVIHGARYINHTLIKYGFKLYDDLIDYTFDTIEYPRERTIALADELQRLADLNMNLPFMYKQMKPTLEHNLKTYLELCFSDTHMPDIVKQFGNDAAVLEQQMDFTLNDEHKVLIHPVHGTWKTYMDLDHGNRTIIDIVRARPYLQEVMGKVK